MAGSKQIHISQTGSCIVFIGVVVFSSHKELDKKIPVVLLDVASNLYIAFALSRALFPAGLVAVAQIDNEIATRENHRAQPHEGALGVDIDPTC